MVDGIDSAIEHIARFGSGHTESIVTGDAAAAEYFLARVDSAIVLPQRVDAVRRCVDIGMGAEIGTRLTASMRSVPVGGRAADELQYVVRGSGQISRDDGEPAAHRIASSYPARA